MQQIGEGGGGDLDAAQVEAVGPRIHGVEAVALLRLALLRETDEDRLAPHLRGERGRIAVEGVAVRQRRNGARRSVKIEIGMGIAAICVMQCSETLRRLARQVVRDLVPRLAGCCLYERAQLGEGRRSRVRRGLFEMLRRRRVAHLHCGGEDAIGVARFFDMAVDHDRVGTGRVQTGDQTRVQRARPAFGFVGEAQRVRRALFDGDHDGLGRRVTRAALFEQEIEADVFFRGLPERQDQQHRPEQRGEQTDEERSEQRARLPCAGFWGHGRQTYHGGRGVRRGLHWLHCAQAVHRGASGLVKGCTARRCPRCAPLPREHVFDKTPAESCSRLNRLPQAAQIKATAMLKNIPLFSGLNEAEIAEIARHAIVRSYPENTVLINEGDHSDTLYVIQEGKVKVYLADEQGKEIVLNQQGPGEYFGELALLDDAARSASVMTLERSSFCVLSKDVFKDVLAKNPNIAVSLIKDLTHRVRALTDNVKSLALLDVYGRVAKTLLGMATPQGDRLVIESKLTQQDIADRVGASREMVSRILKDLATGGYIHMEQKHIVIHDRLPSRY